MTTGTPFSIDRPLLTHFASQPLSGERRPFLRWAGSKRSLLAHIVPLLPDSFGRYWEPFLGGGALFFLLRPSAATISDSCTELIDTYREIRDNPAEILAWLADKKPDKDFYYELRKRRSIDPTQRAAEFIYLNRTCWNGLYRVNSRGEFNVPYGKPKTDVLIDEANILACSEALQTADLRALDFEEAVAECAAGDLVYFDPPYVTGHNNNGFVDYNERLFSWHDQERLAKLARDLVSRGVSVIVSNAAHPPLLALYEGFRRLVFERNSTLASSARFRGPVREVVLFSTTARV